MTSLTTNAHADRPRFGLGAVIKSIGNALVMIAETNSRVRQAEALNALSDAQLKDRGLRREDITRRVFGDMYYL